MARPLRPLSERRPRRTHISAEQLASLTHEFRTPLNGVLGIVHLLEGTPLSGEQQAYVSALRESGEHLLHLVNDVLDFAKLAERKVELNPQPICVEELLRAVTELLAPRAAESGLELGWAASGDAGDILADEGRLKQVLLNFAGNAVKFTRSGGVLLGAVRSGARLRFTVEDTGPGVDEADRERIFEAFAQTDVAAADGVGSGLGLAIAKRLALAMAGEVGVETARGGGALFWFEAHFPALDAKPADPPLAGRTVAVVSPSRIVREAARRQIQACGAKAVSSADLEAIAARTTPGDIVLIDQALPGSERAARSLDRPCLLLLAADQGDRSGRRRRAGYAGYLVKPLRREALADQVLRAAGAARQPRKPAEDQRRRGPAAPGARILLVEDNPINAMLARALLAREGCAVEHAASGEEALAAARVAAFDLILMDMRMPGLSGEDTARRLRSEGVRTPIVALTANTCDEDRKACLAAGMDDFLAKPLLPDDLRATLTRWAGGGWTERAAQAKVG